MADGFDFNALFQRMGMGGGSKASGGGDGANEKDMLEHALEGGERALGTFSKGLLGLDLGKFGSSSIAQGMEHNGVASSNIPSLVSNINANGGLIAQIAHVLVKNGVITDHTAGVGGGMGEMALGNLPSPLPMDAPAIMPAGRGGEMEMSFTS